MNAPGVKQQESDRREARLDRRVRRTPVFSRYWLRGRRRGSRRGGDEGQVYVDRYTGYEWGLAVSVVSLSVCDLILTLVYLSLGGEEGNPIMQRLLDHSEGAFIGVKCAVSLVGAIVLLVHVRFRRARASLTGLVVLYVALIIYHLVTWVPAVLSES